VGVQAAQVSTLADAVRLVQRLFSEAGDGTPIFVGAQHLDNLGPGFALGMISIEVMRPCVFLRGMSSGSAADP